jgi:alanine racemase
VDTEARLSIDLGAVVANWRRLGGVNGAPCAAVVKADGYGLGAGPVGRALQAVGCRHFFVAHLAEGLALRAALGPGAMVAVLNGFAAGADGVAGLVPVLNSLADIAAHQGRPAILQLDTGMARLGVPPEEWGQLGGLKAMFLMTHLAVADQPEHPLNAMQAGRFAAARGQFPGVPGSLAASSGIFLGPDFASDLARPGAALYGINPTPGAPNPMRPVVRLEAPVLQVREIPFGTPVGYGATWVAERPSRVATVAAGYADGYLRVLSGRAVASFQGQPVPLIGRVSMDLTTFDVTDLPGLRPGDALTLIGPGGGAGCTPDELAERAGTIGYEILTSLGARYRRQYQPA